MKLTEHFQEKDSLNPSNEELLNVIRLSDKRGVGTSEIVNEVDLKEDAVRDRMHGLEAEGRVVSETIGSELDYDFVWYLSESERIQPVNPDLANLVKWCEWTKNFGKAVFNGGKIIGSAGIVIILLTLTALVQGIEFGRQDPAFILAGGWATVIGSAGAATIGGGLILFGHLAERFGEWMDE